MLIEQNSKYEIHQDYMHTLSAPDFAKIRKLRLAHPDSGFAQLVRDKLFLKKKIKIFYYKNVSNDSILGWSIVVPKSLCYTMEKMIWVYVHASLRRKGIGTLLFNHAKKSTGNKITVCRHSRNATGFFDSLNAPR